MLFLVENDSVTKVLLFFTKSYDRSVYKYIIQQGIVIQHFCELFKHFFPIRTKTDFKA